MALYNGKAHTGLFFKAEMATTKHVPVSFANAQSYRRRKIGLKEDSFNLMTISRNDEIATVSAWACHETIVRA
jgi:hypothetical protein